MILRHQGLEVGGGDVIGASLMDAPFAEKAVGDPAEHAQDPDAVVALHPAPVIVVGDIQTLVQPAFNPPTGAVEPQPPDRREDCRRGAGD
jgi:hypothetical protein